MSEFVPASQLYIVESRTPIAHPAHQATDADVQNALEEREIRADGGRTHSSSAPDCYDCGARVSRHTARIYVQSDRQAAKTLCQSCQTAYPYENQYRPINGPTRSYYDISNRGGEP
ncbi:hypothetical protein [Natronorubrum tibetense]|uniref:Uncharacterized protein n=1 Tax=Natronorubrum tibetense GA33 TaxID=1114856 RepID=L9WCX8_9EURY|nr:hypothetical protein [Natronorubrum tibetense]ELY46168.1 hypothetical protein C496_01336 [Natronorubrum tibetense GA33]